MNGRKKQGKKTGKKLPRDPPTKRSYHQAHLAEIKKPLLIAIIAVAALVILSLLLFVAPQFAGKAAYPGLNKAKVNIGYDAKTDLFFVTVDMGPTAATSGVYYELTSPTPGFNICTGHRVINKFGGGFPFSSCDTKLKKLIFSDATLNDAKFKKGKFNITLLKLKTTGLNTIKLNLNPIDVYDSKTGKDLFPAGQLFTIPLSCKPGKTISCGTNLGLCATGKKTCSRTKTWGSCSGGITPKKELCDAKDNDCDGKTDENTCKTAANCGKFGKKCSGSTPACSSGKCVALSTLSACTDADGDKYVSEALNTCNNLKITGFKGWGDCDDKSKTTIACPSGKTCINKKCVQKPIPRRTGGGGGRRCISNISCSTWSFCNASLQTARTCYDYAGCQLNQEQVKSCSPCLESWVCTPWDACQAGTNTRKCYDEHKCNTIQKKPILQKGCQAQATGPAPARITPFVPPATPPPQVATPAPVSFWSNLWNNYKTWLIAIPSALILLTIALLLFLHFRPVEVANLEEFRQWVQAERKRGITKEQMRSTIHNKTGWTDKELDQVFDELGQKSKKPASPQLQQPLNRTPGKTNQTQNFKPAQQPQLIKKK